MTETQTGPETGPEHEPPPDRWHSENLRDYASLRRSRADRKVAGVAGGLGRHLNIDPTILRVLFVVLVFFGGAGLLLYGAFWLFTPEEDTGHSVIHTSDSTRNVLLAVAAILAALAAVGDTWNGVGFPWPLVVAGLVLAAILLPRDSRRASAGAAPPAPPDGSSPAWAPPPPVPPTRDPRRTGPVLFGTTLALVALALGVLGIWDVSGGTATDAAYPALALAVIGAMLVLGAFVGRAGGLILLGVVAALSLSAAAIGGPSYDGDRDVVVRPTSAADLAGSYDVPAGRIEVDLTAVSDPEELDGRTLRLELNAGELVVIVPEDVSVRYDAQIAYGGSIELPGLVRDGWGPEASGTVSGADPVAVIDLEADLDFGRIAVQRR